VRFDRPPRCRIVEVGLNDLWQLDEAVSDLNKILQ